MDLRLYQWASPQEASSFRSELRCFRLAVPSTEMRLVLASPGVVPLGALLGHSSSHEERGPGVGSTQLQVPIEAMK